MSHRPHLPVRTGAAGLLALALVACEAAPTSPPAAEGLHAHRAPPVVTAAAGNAEVNRWLARLRGALAPYHRIGVADDAGWDTDITGCMELPGVGGMGHHFADVGLLDDVVEDTRPEALLYEPQRNGRMRLVAVEYIVPFSDAWPVDGPAPTIHGVSFGANHTFGVWALHAWVWRHNPDGMFADWNPRVNCDHAA